MHISVAPMLRLTNRHCRYLHRLLAKDVLLYTEMITTPALLHGYRKSLYYDPSEHPLALQLAGSDPEQLAKCAVIGEQYGFDEINLNVGCPSKRVQAGNFGACLMPNSDLVAHGINAMAQAVNIPISIKMRLGVDNQDNYQDIYNFVAKIKNQGCKKFIIHARKAVLQKLTPKQNRVIPDLNYAFVYQLKKDFSDLIIILNGGITTIDQIKAALNHVDGVMLGSKAYYDPYFLAIIAKEFYGIKNIPTRAQILQQFLPYVEQQLFLGEKLSVIVKPLLGLFKREAEATKIRATLTTLQTCVDFKLFVRSFTN